MKSKSLLKSTGVVSSLTLVSRILGFVRDMVLAHLFGAGPELDAFFVAFKIPNFMRRLFAEGAFAQAFVPVLSEYQKTKPHEDVRAFVSHMAGTLGSALILITIVAQLAAPLLVSVFAPGFLLDDGRFAMTESMLRITFPYLMFISLTAFSGAILNAYGRFSVPAFTPVLLNLSLIGAATLLSPHMATPVTALAWGVFIAGIAQLCFQLPFLWRLNLLPRPRVNWRDSGVRRVLTLMIPALFGVSVAQISLLFDTLFSSFLPAGSVSWLYYSDRITSLPLGVFGVAIATVILPHLSRKHAEHSAEQFSQTVDWGIRWVLLIGMPAAVGLVMLALPMLTSLFQYGEFTPEDVQMAKQSMLAFAVGVPGFMLVKVCASGFYARQDLRTPVKIAVIALFTNMTLNLLLIVPLKHAGLALATSLSSALNASLLLRALRKQEIFQPALAATKWKKFLFNLLFSCSIMAAVLFYFTAPPKAWFYWQAKERLWHLSGLIVMGILSYVLALFLSGFRFKDVARVAE